MARHVETADALFDSNSDFSPLEPRANFLDPSILESTHTLSSKVPCFFTVNHMHNMLMKATRLNFKTLMSSFLDMTQGHLISRDLKRMPTLDCMEVEIYQALTIDDFDTSGKPISDKVMAHDQYFRRQRKDHVVIRDGLLSSEPIYVQTLLFMKVIFEDEILELCLRQSYKNLHIPHITGFEVIQLATESNYKGIILTKIQNIQYSVFIQRDFVPPNEHEYYLVNTGTDLFRWINSKGELLQMDEDSYVGC